MADAATTTATVSRGAQAAVSLALMLVMGGTFVALAVVSRSTWLESKFSEWEIDRFRSGSEHMMDRGTFMDFEDRLILQQIPQADYARGGVYFFGTSALKWAFKKWELPPGLQPLIGNFGIGATSHELEYQFIRHLVEHEGFLRAGADKIHVVLGLYWSMGLDWNPDNFFGPLWERHGLYEYNREMGIEPVQMEPAIRRLLSERAFCSCFLGGSVNRLTRALTLAFGIPLGESEKIHQPDQVRMWAKRMAGERSRRKGPK